MVDPLPSRPPNEKWPCASVVVVAALCVCACDTYISSVTVWPVTGMLPFDPFRTVPVMAPLPLAARVAPCAAAVPGMLQARSSASATNAVGSRARRVVGVCMLRSPPAPSARRTSCRSHVAGFGSVAPWTLRRAPRLFCFDSRCRGIRWTPGGGVAVFADFLVLHCGKLLVNQPVKRLLALIAGAQRGERAPLIPRAQRIIVMLFEIAEPVVEIHVAQRHLRRSLALGHVSQRVGFGIASRGGGIQPQQRIDDNQQGGEAQQKGNDNRHHTPSLPRRPSRPSSASSSRRSIRR